MRRASLQRFFRRLRPRRGLDVWYHAAYRLPLPGHLHPGPLEPRRSDFAAWYLLRKGRLHIEELHTPHPVSYAKLQLVHHPAYLETLQQPETLGRIFGVHPDAVPVTALLHCLRLACGGTLSAARWAVASGRSTLNLLGGFHHAGPGFGGGFCALNDVAVSVADLRRRGFDQQVVVLDLDAHPPDGTAACLEQDARVWLGSISGSHWGELPRVDETVLPPGSGDEAYLDALRSLLRRMPVARLAFVIAGGDVLQGDPFGLLGMSEGGARQRDHLVAEALQGVPSVWLPGGGYQADAWRVLAGTGLVLSGHASASIPQGEDPLASHYADVARRLAPTSLRDEETRFSQDEVDELLGHAQTRSPLMLGYYTAEGVEYALEQYGMLGQLRRLGYRRFQVSLSTLETGDQIRLTAESDGHRVQLLECVLGRRSVADRPTLYVNWLSLSHPRVGFNPSRPALPGQDVPGLGLAREVSELLGLMAARLELAGVSFRPSWFHMAWAARHRFRFVEEARQGRFEAAMRDLAGLPLNETTQAMASGHVLMNGQPYTWEAEDMVHWLAEDPQAADSPVAKAEKERVHFTLAPATPASSPSR